MCALFLKRYNTFSEFLGKEYNDHICMTFSSNLKEEYKYKAGANLNYTNDYVRINPPDLENKPFFRKLGIDTYSPKINPKIIEPVKKIDFEYKSSESNFV